MRKLENHYPKLKILLIAHIEPLYNPKVSIHYTSLHFTSLDVVIDNYTLSDLVFQEI